MNITFNILGCIPQIGPSIGMGRLAIIGHQAYQEKAEGRAKDIFQVLSQKERPLKILQGICELIPLTGPLLFWSISLSYQVVKK